MSDGNLDFEKSRSFVDGILNRFPAFIFALNTQNELLYGNEMFDALMKEQSGSQNLINKVLAYKENEDCEKIDDSFMLVFAGNNYKTSAYPSVWINNEPCFVYIGFDISAIKSFGEKYSESAKLDSITGTYNRQAGIDFLIQNINMLESSGTVFTVCYLDIDGMRNINEKFGMPAGDAYIEAVVTVILNSIRQTDIFARLDGDRFLIVFPKCRYEVVDNIIGTVVTRLDVINETSAPEGVHYSISFGILEVSAEMDLDAEEIIKTAEEVMIEMKRSKTV